MKRLEGLDYLEEMEGVGDCISMNEEQAVESIEMAYFREVQ